MAKGVRIGAILATHRGNGVCHYKGPVAMADIEFQVLMFHTNQKCFSVGWASVRIPWYP